VKFVHVFGRPLQVTVRLMLQDGCTVCSVCNFGVLWPNGSMDQDAAWYRYRGRLRSRRHCVRWGLSSPYGKGHSSPHFSAHVYFGLCLLWPKGRPSHQLLSSCKRTDIQTDMLVAILRTFTEGEVTKDHVTDHRLSFVA